MVVYLLIFSKKKLYDGVSAERQRRREKRECSLKAKEMAAGLSDNPSAAAADCHCHPLPLPPITAAAHCRCRPLPLLPIAAAAHHHCRPSPLPPAAATAVGQHSRVIALSGHQRQCWGVGGSTLALGRPWGLSSCTLVWLQPLGWGGGRAVVHWQSDCNFRALALAYCCQRGGGRYNQH